MKCKIEFVRLFFFFFLSFFPDHFKMMSPPPSSSKPVFLLGAAVCLKCTHSFNFLFFQFLVLMSKLWNQICGWEICSCPWRGFQNKSHPRLFDIAVFCMSVYQWVFFDSPSNDRQRAVGFWRSKRRHTFTLFLWLVFTRSFRLTSQDRFHLMAALSNQVRHFEDWKTSLDYCWGEADPPYT